MRRSSKKNAKTAAESGYSIRSNGDKDAFVSPMRQFDKFPRWPVFVIFGLLGMFSYQAYTDPEGTSDSAKITALLSAGTAFAAYLGFVIPPIPQDVAFHNFADKRCLCCKVPNTMDVLSNVPFFVVGLVSLALQATGNLNDGASPNAKRAWAFLYASIVLVGAGSSYYHWAPDNNTLVWDRLPMTLGFTSLTALVMDEHMGTGFAVLPAFVLIGAASVWYWVYTDDLRPYIFVQAFPLLALPFTLLLFDGKYDRRDYYIYALAWYAFAKFAEVKDVSIFRATGIISGHSLKHLAAAAGLAMITRMCMLRQG